MLLTATVVPHTSKIIKNIHEYCEREEICCNLEHLEHLEQIQLSGITLEN